MKTFNDILNLLSSEEFGDASSKRVYEIIEDMENVEIKYSYFDGDGSEQTQFGSITGKEAADMLRDFETEIFDGFDYYSVNGDKIKLSTSAWSYSLPLVKYEKLVMRNLEENHYD